MLTNHLCSLSWSFGNLWKLTPRSFDAGPYQQPQLAQRGILAASYVLADRLKWRALQICSNETFYVTDSVAAPPSGQSGASRETSIGKRDHCVSRSDEDSLLRLLRNVAKAATAEEYAEELQNLQSSDLWMGNKNLRTWFGTNGFPRPMCEFKVAVHTNNGVERQNETLKHSYLQGYKNCSLSEMLTVVTSEFLSNIYRKYIELNVKYSSSYRQYTTNIPQFL
ncbi:hypothetical protein Bbelb_316790 [Branchiostoma belcheri]|nr:hypothetical protein Bbelb_316790 [Branchiostoma belcheri]